MPALDFLSLNIFKLLLKIKVDIQTEIEMANFVGNIERYEKMEVLLIGEKMREALHDAGLVKNRKYHLRTYRSCIVGKELVDWLVKNKHCESRQAAVEGLQILQQHHIVHHVCDDHDMKDENLFYRFRRDDDTYTQDKDLALFCRALELYNGLSTRTSGIIRSYQQDGELFRNAFQGSEFIDYLLKEGLVFSREEGVILGRRLLENDTIKHVTDDYHFRDDNRLLYQFSLDFSRRRHLAEVFNYVPRRPTRSASGSEGRRQFQFQPPSDVASASRSMPQLSRSDSHHSDNNNPAPAEAIRDRTASSREQDSGNDTDSSETAVENVNTTRSVLLRHASVDELESPDTPYVKQTVKIQSDPVGYGFVVRGDSPTYVQAVDPMGPAAVAGLKVRQYLYSVNGQYVLRSDHKTVAKLIMQSLSHVSIVVMTHKRDVPNDDI